MNKITNLGAKLEIKHAQIVDGLEQNYQEYELPEPNYSDDDEWDSIPCIDHVRILRTPVQMQVLSHAAQEVHPEKSLLMHTKQRHIHITQRS